MNIKREIKNNPIGEHHLFDKADDVPYFICYLISYYSERNDFTGFIKAAFIA